MARWGIAETGSLVFHSGAETPILANFLPLHHLVMLRASAIVPYLDGYAAAAAATGGKPPHNEGAHMTALTGLAWLLLLQAAGEAIAHATKLPIPGPVIGLGLLLVALQFDWGRAPVAAAAQMLLSNLSLLFVPVGVGVITHLALVSQYGLQLLLLIVVSTWVGMAVTALVLRALLPAPSQQESANG